MESKENIGKPPALGYRHVLVLIGFSSLFLITAQRLSLSVAIVVMVNQTEPNLSNGKYFAATTCPENEETKNASWKKREGKFLWDSKEQGLILGIGFFGFSLAAIPVSRLVRTFQARRVTLFGSLLSSVTTLLCPVASEFHVNAMIVVQFIRGIGQGLLFLSLFALMANWFHPNERGLLSTIVISGYSIGSMFAAAISGFICDTPELGWPAVFYVIGGIGVFQAILVIALLHETPQEHPKISLDELLYLTDDEKKSASNKIPVTPWRQIFTSSPFYALLIGIFGQYWCFSYFWTVHSTFLGTIHHFPITENGVWSCVPFILKASGEWSSSAISNWFLMKKYLSVDALRKYCNSFGCIGYSAGLLGVYFSGCNRHITAITAAMALFFTGVGSAGSMIVCLDMAPRFSGPLSYFLHGTGSLLSFIQPIFVGSITTNKILEEWQTVFIISISFVMITCIVFAVFGSANVQPWNFVEEEVDKNMNTVGTDKKKEISTKEEEEKEEISIET